MCSGITRQSRSHLTQMDFTSEVARIRALAYRSVKRKFVLVTSL